MKTCRYGTRNMTSKNNYMTVCLKGIAMGAADVVPGVSGGTIAFITGIYERLVNAIKGIDLKALKLLFTGRFGPFWRKIDGNFLGSLVLGIAISIFSLARLMTWLLNHHPIPTWAFFFGLIVASSVMVSRDAGRWNAGKIIAFLAGAAAVYAITVVTPASTPETWWFIMLSGAIAICAMILPGISGAFILLLLDKYAFMMDAVGELRFGVIAIFAVGAIVGIVAFSHFLSWLLSRHAGITVAVLTGFMIGSLNKIWPWKKPVETYLDSHGNIKPITEVNISPSAYESLFGTDSGLWQAILMCALGILLIGAIQFAAWYKSKNGMC